MKPVLNQFIRLLLPIVFECLQQALDRDTIKEGRRDEESENNSQK
ncbi:MAG: hypothetical protein ABIH23_24315 [bacterium]